LKPITLLLLAVASLCAQVVTIPNEGMPAVRAKMNSNFSWLDNNKPTIQFSSALDATGVTNVSAAFQAAVNLNAGKVLRCENATYLITNINVPANTSIVGNCTLKSVVLASIVSSPILRITGDGVILRGIKFDGQRASQPADGFSDSFNTGGAGTGRAYRAAVLADATVYPAILSLTVTDCEITAMYGAGIATLNVAPVVFERNWVHDTNFEGLYAYGAAIPAITISITSASTAATLSAAGLRKFQRVTVVGLTGVRQVMTVAGTAVTFDIAADATVSGAILYPVLEGQRVVGNRFLNVQSGHATTNANNVVFQRAYNSVFSHNIAFNGERNILKCEICGNTTIADNVYDTNVVPSFNGLQLQTIGTPTSGIIPPTGMQFINNKLSNTGIGIAVQAPGFSGVVSGNVFTNMTGTVGNGGDCIQVGASATLEINDNVCTNPRRYGIYVSEGSPGIVIQRNHVIGGSASAGGVIIQASLANGSSLHINNNILTGFTGTNTAPIDIRTANSATISGVVVRNNVISTGGGSALGYVFGGVASTITGIFGGNINDGIISNNQPGMVSETPTLTMMRPDSTPATIATTETVLKTVTFPANYLRAGASLRITASGTTAGTAGTKTVTLRVGTVTLTGTALCTVTNAAANNDNWACEAEVDFITPASEQHRAISWKASTPTLTPMGGLAMNNATTAVIVELNGVVANAADSITLRTMRVDVLQ